LKNVFYAVPILLCVDSFAFTRLYFVFSFILRNVLLTIIVTRWAGPGGIYA